MVSRALDIGRSGETTNLRLKELKKTLGTEEVDALKQNKMMGNERQRKFRDTRRGNCKYCGSNHQRGACPAFGQRCNNCGRQNHFAKVCLQKKYSPVSALTQDTRPDSSDEDSGEFVATLDLDPNWRKSWPPKATTHNHATMTIKGRRNTSFQIDTGATCNVIRATELRGTNYEKKVFATDQVLRMYNSSTLVPTGIRYVQLTNPTSDKKYNVKFVVVEDKDANINLLGRRAAQQINLMKSITRTYRTE